MQTPHEFADILGPTYKKEILRELLDNPDHEYTVKELADEISASYNTVKKFLDQLKELDIVSYHKKGNYTLLTYEPGSKYHDILRSMFEVDARDLRETAEEFAKEFYEEFDDRVRSIILFGQVARGTAKRGSDIDLLILVDDWEFRQEINEIARRNTYETNKFSHILPLTETVDGFVSNLEEDSTFETNVKRDGILLAGDPIDELSG